MLRMARALSVIGLITLLLAGWTGIALAATPSTAELYLNRDGTLDVSVEHQLSGQAHSRQLAILLDEQQSLTNLSVSFDDTALTEVADAPRTGQYTSTRTDGALALELNLPAPEGKLSLAYQVYGAVRVYQDVADWQWSVLGELGMSDTGAEQITVTLPDLIDPDQTRLWLHTARPYLVERPDNQTYLIELDARGEHDRLTLRGIVPTTAMASGVADPSQRREAIIRAEDTLAASYANERSKQALFDRLKFGLLLWQPLALLLWLWLTRRLGSRLQKLRDYAVEQSTAPTRRSPMGVLQLLDREAANRTQALTAEVFALARLGALKFEEETHVSAGLLGARTRHTIRLLNRLPDDRVKLTTEQTALHAMIFAQSEEVPLTSLTFKDWLMHLRQHPEKVQEVQQELHEANQALLDQQHTPLRTMAQRRLAQYWLLSLLLGLAAPYLWLFGLLATRWLKRIMPTVEDERWQWEQFATYLTTLSGRAELPARVRDQWQDLLVYGLALGEIDAILDRLPEILQSTVNQPNWYTLAGEPNFNTASIEAFVQRVDEIQRELHHVWKKTLA